MKKGRKTLSLLSRSPDETALLGEMLADALRGGDIVGLSGELGAGKTVLVKGVCKALEVRERVTSSTFVLLRLLSGRLPVYHFDLYRLNCAEELRDLGYEEFMFGDGVSLIEWPEKLDMPPEHYLHITLEYVPEQENHRRILISSEAPELHEMMKTLAIPLQILYREPSL
jgi:tRNA threonylcarbamoyladenosine biosynthesis protein TsaE